MQNEENVAENITQKLEDYDKKLKERLKMSKRKHPSIDYINQLYAKAKNNVRQRGNVKSKKFVVRPAAQQTIKMMGKHH